ncbi:MAG: hypothetical protein BRD36_00295 [Bacteroidetes bacterium QH_7_64_110]|nr:MAG: hypothetical protein BRD36_00295 [Bacteroidetes bacterium QH_7_64_110]
MPAERVIRLLREKEVENVHYHDPHVPSYSVKLENGETKTIPSVELTPEALQSCDVAAVVTAHDDYDAEAIARHAPHIVDTRNALSDIDDPDLRQKITLLGGGKQSDGDPW